MMDQTEIERMAIEALVDAEIADAKTKAYGTCTAGNHLEGDFGSWDDWSALVTRVALRAAAKARAEAMEEAAVIAQAQGPTLIRWWGDGQANAAAQECASAIRAAAQKERSEAALHALADDAQRLGLDY